MGLPFCVAVDTSEKVYVSEYHNGRVSVFTSEGDYVSSFGRGTLALPFGLAVDSSGVVYRYVCNRNGYNIKLY